MESTAELGAELLVWIQIYDRTHNKLTGLGKEVNDLAEKQVRRLLDLAQASGV
jgi:hypothetical protein